MSGMTTMRSQALSLGPSRVLPTKSHVRSWRAQSTHSCFLHPTSKLSCGSSLLILTSVHCSQAAGPRGIIAGVLAGAILGSVIGGYQNIVSFVQGKRD